MIKSPYSDKIVSVDRSPSCYVDNAYFKEKMLEDKENTNYKNYPIKLQALRVGWIIQE